MDVEMTPHGLYRLGAGGNKMNLRGWWGVQKANNSQRLNERFHLCGS